MEDRAVLKIHLYKVADNIDQLAALASGKGIIFMVKANGYGHGMVDIVRFAHLEKEIKKFGVATLNEAIELRELLWGESLEIIVFSDLRLRESYSTYLDRRIIPVIADFDDLIFFLENSGSNSLPLYLKWNTGMNRLGISWDRVGDVVGALKRFGKSNIEHVMTHFANAHLAVSENPMNRLQLQRFAELKREMRGSGIGIDETSIANSGLIEQGEGLEESHIRPGLMLYGPSALSFVPDRGRRWKGSLISTLEVKIIKDYALEEGSVVGYGATPVERQGRVAIAGIGYADGISTSYEGGRIPYRGEELVIFGRVNMDMIQLFAKKGAPCPRTGESIVLWSEKNLQHLSWHANRSFYEMFCALGSRITRHYTLK